MAQSFLSDRLPLGTVEQVLANYRMKDGSIIYGEKTNEAVLAHVNVFLFASDHSWDLLQMVSTQKLTQLLLRVDSSKVKIRKAVNEAASLVALHTNLSSKNEEHIQSVLTTFVIHNFDNFVNNGVIPGEDCYLARNVKQELAKHLKSVNISKPDQLKNKEKLAKVQAELKEMLKSAKEPEEKSVKQPSVIHKVKSLLLSSTETKDETIKEEAVEEEDVKDEDGKKEPGEKCSGGCYH
jgi:hypothetical protein